MENGTVYKEIFFDDGEAVATVEGTGPSAAVRYTHTDHLTGSALVTDAVGTQVQLLDYHPFGTQRINEQTTDYNIKRKFAGHESDDELGLSYMLARYYNPSTGKFLSEDPAFLELPKAYIDRLISDPQQMNSYAYGRNNPLTYRDPDGNIVETVVDVAMGLYDGGRFAYWGVQAVGSSAGIGLTHLFGDGPSTQLVQQKQQAWGKLGQATVDVGIDAVGAGIPFVPAVGLRAGVQGLGMGSGLYILLYVPARKSKR